MQVADYGVYIIISQGRTGIYSEKFRRGLAAEWMKNPIILQVSNNTFTFIFQPNSARIFFNTARICQLRETLCL